MFKSILWNSTHNEVKSEAEMISVFQLCQKIVEKIS